MLEVNDIRKTFNARTPNEVVALAGVSLSMEPGEFVSLVGTNGSGKSTLLNAIAGAFLLDSGQIRLDGRDVTRWREHRRAALIGRVFQNPFAGTAPAMTIAENLVLAARRGMFRGLGWALGSRARREIEQRVRGLNMGLERRLESPIGTLSGGQRQALTLLMATWSLPRLLLLDEHTAALDPQERPAGRLAHERDHPAGRADHPDGHPLDATSGESQRPHHHDASGTDHSGLSRRGKAKGPHGRPRREIRAGAPARAARRERGRGAGEAVRLTIRYDS